MSTISKTYNCAHNILELADILPNVYFTTNMKLFTKKNFKYGLIEELSIDVRLKKISKLHEIIV